MNRLIELKNNKSNSSNAHRHTADEQKAAEAQRDKLLEPSSPLPSSKSSVLPVSSSHVGKQGSHEQAYFTIHVTPEPQCSFVSFETNAVLPSYTALIRSVVSLFQPSQFCVSLFVDGGSRISDSRLGTEWEHPDYTTKGTTHHSFQAGYNATVSIHHRKIHTNAMETMSSSS